MGSKNSRNSSRMLNHSIETKIEKLDIEYFDNVTNLNLIYSYLKNTF